MKRQITLAALTLTAAAACTAGFLFAASPSLAVSAAEWGAVSLEEEYAYGTQFTVPARTVTVDGNTQAATSVLCSPGGGASLAAQTALDEAGMWTLSYTAQINGVVYRQDETFEVFDAIASAGDESEVVYEAYTVPGAAAPTDTQGLQVRLAQGDVLRFSPIVDLTGARSSDTIIELFVTPSNIGAYDFEQVIVTLTDAEDPDCYLRISGRRSSDGINYPYTYFLAGGNDQPMSGWEGSRNILHVNNEWGSSVQHSFYGYYPSAPDTTPDRVCLRISYDAATRSVYVNNSFVIDLDSSQYFSTLWNGFTSGKVRVSVSADLYSSATADFMVTYLAGVDLAADKLTDADAPEITVDTQYSAMPDAKVGMAYPIPSATARDDYSGDCPVTARVFYNYTSSNAATVAVENGTFTPGREGLYAIVYRASDGMRNMAEKVVWVRAKQSVPAVTLELSASEISGLAGELADLPAATAGGGVGNVTVKASAALNGEEIDLSDGFRPVKPGTYLITYTATDYIGQTATAVCSAVIAPNDTPVFTEDPVLPRYLISGSPYNVPEVYATDYSGSEPQRLLAEVTLEDANGTQTVSGTVTPTVLENGDPVRLIFRIAGTDAMLEREVPAILAFAASEGRMRLQMQNYFVAEGASVQTHDDGATISAGRADGAFTFANKLLAEGFSLSLLGLPAQSHFEGLRVTLTDSLDSSVSVSAVLTRSGSASVAQVGGMQMELTAGFAVNSPSNVFVFGYRGGSLSVNGSSIAPALTDGGAAFNGFSSGYVYLSVAFIGAQEGDAFDVQNINDQPISNAANDRIRPKIAILGTYGDVAEIGSVQTVHPAIAGDVLDPNTTLSLTVADRDGNPVTAADGTVLENVTPDREFTFTVSEYKQLFVTYTASDTFSGRDYQFSYAITVEDREPPTVSFSHDFATSVQAGGVIVIPDFTVSDNVTAAENLRVNKFVLTPGGALVELTGNSNSFRPSRTGEYEVRIVVVDEAGNIAMIRQIVTVTE